MIYFEKSRIQAVLALLNQVTVHGAENLRNLLACINALETGVNSNSTENKEEQSND